MELESLIESMWGICDNALDKFHPRTNAEAVQLDIAVRLMPAWRAITRAMAINPESVQFGYGRLDVLNHVVKLPPVKPRGPEQRLELVYSRATALVYIGEMVSSNKAEATPQVQFSVTEMFPDSLRELYSAWDTIEERIETPPSQWLGEGTYRLVQTFKGYLDVLMNQTAFEIGFVGKGAYQNDMSRIEGLNLIGCTLSTTADAKSSMILLNRIIGPKHTQPLKVSPPSFDRRGIIRIDEQLGLVIDAITNS